MIDPFQHIDSIFALRSVDVATVNRTLGVQLTKERENPYWVFYEAAANDQFERLNFNLSRDGIRWLLAWDYRSDVAPYEHDVDLKRFGVVKDIQMNPGIMPEGTVTYEFQRANIKVLVEILATSRRLKGAALHKELGDAQPGYL
ncbi:MAG: hypothetical protein QM784_39010 [Polyangiaceae bacterium]